MTRRTTLVLAALVALAIPGCATGGATDQQAGIVVPAGLTAFEDLAAAIDGFDGVARLETIATLESKSGEREQVSHLTAVRYPNGDQSVETGLGADALRYLSVGGAFYGDVGNGWEEMPDLADSLQEQLTGLLGLDPDARATLTETAIGYVATLTAESAESTVTFTLDEDRTLVAVALISNEPGGDILWIDTTVTYPTAAAPLTVPADAPTASAEGAGSAADRTAAEVTLRDAAAEVERLLTGRRVAAVSIDMVAQALVDNGVYVDIETAFDPWSLGFANDGTRIELVTSDGSGTCLHVTLSAEETSTITSDGQGASTDLGFACGTTISHTGPLLGES